MLLDEPEFLISSTQKKQVRYEKMTFDIIYSNPPEYVNVKIRSRTLQYSSLGYIVLSFHLKQRSSSDLSGLFFNKSCLEEMISHIQNGNDYILNYPYKRVDNHQYKIYVEKNVLYFTVITSGRSNIIYSFDITDENRIEVCNDLHELNIMLINESLINVPFMGHIPNNITDEDIYLINEINDNEGAFMQVKTKKRMPKPSPHLMQTRTQNEERWKYVMGFFSGNLYSHNFNNEIN